MCNLGNDPRPGPMTEYLQPTVAFDRPIIVQQCNLDMACHESRFRPGVDHRQVVPKAT